MSWFGWLRKEKQATGTKPYEFTDDERALSAQTRRDAARMKRLEQEMRMREFELEMKERQLKLEERQRALEDSQEDDGDDFDDDDDGNEDGMLLQLLGNVLTKMQAQAPPAQAAAPSAAPQAPPTDDELRALKARIPPANLAILRNMTDAQIIEQLQMYSPDFYRRCTPEVLARIPAIVKE